MKNLLFIFIIILTIGSCSHNSNSNPNCEDVKLVVKSNDPQCLEYWTADTVFCTNPFLVRLMDTLYQFVRSDSFPSEDIRNDIEWMNRYRRQLANYYCRNYETTAKFNQDEDVDMDAVIAVYDLTEYDMADSVIEEARKLWLLDDDDSTMGMIIHNDTERTRLIFEQFNEFSRLYDKCEKQEQREMLVDEFAAWLDLGELMSHIFANFTDMHFYGGSIRGPITSAGMLDIWRAHIDLYRKEYSLLFKDEPYNDTGTLVKPARRLLLDCCIEAFSDYENSCLKDEYEDYQETVNDTKKLLRRLPSTIDKWIDARKPWEEEMCTDWLRPTYPRSTSEVLIKFAHLLCSVQ